MTRRRILVLFLGFVVTLLGATYVILRETGASREYLKQVLGRFIRPAFRVESANLNLGQGSVHFKFSIPNPRSKDLPPLLTAAEVAVSMNTNPLGDVGAVHKVTVRGLDLNLSLAEGEALALDEVLSLPEVKGRPKVTRDTPAIIVEDSRATLRLAKDAPPLLFQDVNLRLLPEEHGSHVVLTGSMSSPLGRLVQVRGTGDLDKMEFRVVVEATDVALKPAIARSFSPALESYLAQAKVDGTARKVSLWVEYPGAADAASKPLGGISIEVSELACMLPDLPYPLEGAAGKVSATTRGGGTIKFELGKQSSEGDLNAHGLVSGLLDGKPAIDARLSLKNMQVRPELARAVRSQPDAQHVWDAFQPSDGRTSAELRLWNDTPGAPLQVAMDLALDGVSASFAGFPATAARDAICFPYPLRDIHGLVQLRPGWLSIHDVLGHADGGEVKLNGKVKLDAADADQTWLEIDGHNIAFAPALRDAIEAFMPSARAIYDEYQPAGRADVAVRLRTHAERKEPDYVLQIRPLAASAAYRSFPYRVDAVAGLVEISNAGVTIDLSGSRGPSQVRVDGRFLRQDSDGNGAALRSELWLKVAAVPFDAELRQALVAFEPGMDSLWSYLSPMGTADCEVTMWRDAAAREFSYDVRIDVAGASVQVADLQIPLEKLQGAVFIHGTGPRSRTDIQTVRGEIHNDPGQPPAPLLLQGTVLSDGTSHDLDLTTVVRGLQLNHDLAVALDKNGSFNLRAWNVLQPSGLVDVIARQTKRATEPHATQRLRVQLRGVNSHAAMLPAPATGLFGEMTVVDGKAEFKDIRGRIGGAEVICKQGSVRHEDGAAIVESTVTAEDFPVDENLAHLMTGPLRRAYLDRNVHGSARVNELSMTFWFPDSGDDFRVRFAGQFRSHDLRLLLAAPLEEINGTWNVREGRVDESGGSVEGDLQDISLRVFQHRVNGLKCSYRADAGSIVLTDASARMHGGVLHGQSDGAAAMRYELAGEGTLSAALQWEGLSLSDFLAASGKTDAALRGTLSGHLALERLTGTDLVDMRASGMVKVSEGRLGESPLFAGLYSYLTPKNRPQFEAAELEFTLRDRAMQVPRFQLWSPSMEVSGKGAIGTDGYLNLVLEVPNLFGSSADWLLVPALLRELTSNMLQFHLYGYLRDPKVKLRWLGQRAPQRAPIEPIAPDLPARPHRRF